MTHREDIKAWLGTLNIEGKAVVDWCAGTKPVVKYVQGSALQYLSIDKLGHVEASRVEDVCIPELDLGQLFNIAFCIEGMEHVKYPKILLRNIHKNLQVGGDLYMSVPFLFPIHSEEDYWRFTDQGLKFLLEDAGFKVDYISDTTDQQGWLVHATKL